MQAQLKCPNCKKFFDRENTTCPHCGEKISNEEREIQLKRIQTNKKILSIFIPLFILILALFIFLPKKNETKKDEIQTNILSYTLVNKEINTSATLGRDRLYVTVAATGNQEQATQQDLINTAIHAAMTYAGEQPVIIVVLNSQNTGSVWADKLLSAVTYAPDGKGYSGQDTTPKFFDARACKRGFTQDELTYLRLWSELRQKYLDPRTDGVALDKEEILEAEIEQKMGKKLPSDPIFNIPENVELVSK